MTPIVVEIAGVRIALERAEAAGGHMPDDIRARYALFLADGPADFTLELAACPSGKHDPDAMPVVKRLAPSRFSIEYGGLRGEIDLTARRGRAEVPDSVFVVDSLLRITMSHLLLERRGVLLHSSGVLRDGRVLVCFGPSGVGKTTVAKSVPEAQVLCDEVMALVLQPDGSVVAHGTPFHGELGTCRPGSGPLAALCRLRQAPEARLTPLRPATAARELLGAILFFCREPDLAERLLELAAAICQARTFSLEFALTTHVPDYVVAHLR